MQSGESLSPSNCMVAKCNRSTPSAVSNCRVHVAVQLRAATLLEACKQETVGVNQAACLHAYSARFILFNGINSFQRGCRKPIYLLLRISPCNCKHHPVQEGQLRLATLNTALLSSVIFLEFFEILPHHHLNNFLPMALWQHPIYVVSVLFVFTSTLFFSVYLATTITDTARAREEETRDLKENLEEKVLELNLHEKTFYLSGTSSSRLSTVCTKGLFSWMKEIK